MESVQLLDLIGTISVWPLSEAELSAAAAKIARLIGAPFAAIGSVVSPGRPDGASAERIGYHLAENGGVIVNPELLREFLKKRLAQLSGDPSVPRYLQVAREPGAIPALLSSPHLAIAGIQVAADKSAGARGATRWLDYGWIAIATPKALTAKDELAFTAVVLFLRHLAETRQLESALNLRNQFLSIASHELKTPLTSIYGMLQLEERMIRLKRDDDSFLTREKLGTYFKMVIRQVERLNELIDGLLDVSRIQSGRFMVEPSEADAAAILREVISSRLGVIATEAGVRLNVEAPDSFDAWVDPIRFEEVATNLVMNAIRFSPEGGAVWIKLRDEGGSFRLAVRDQGPSVPPEDRERIFQPFERAQRTARLGGLGLGLYISRQIAQLHGGNVSLAESIPGKGNVFEATFPVRNLSLVAGQA